MKKAIRGIVFLILLTLIIFRVYGVLKWKDTSGDYISATKQLYSTEDNLIDVIFLGSSHCYCSIYPDVLWGKYGFSAFNMTTSGQDKNSTYYLLKEALKTQSPKVVCVELWGLTFDKHGVQGNVYRNMMALDLSQNSIDLVRSYVDEAEQADYILKWPIVHTRYKEVEQYDFIPYEFSNYGRSVEASFHTGYSVEPTEALECNEIAELTDTNKEWLENLYQLSEEEGFDLVLFLAPTGIDLEQQKQVNAAKVFAEERGIPFFDFNRLGSDIGIDYGCDFVDGTHLNANGAEKITGYLGDYFEANYGLEDYRGNEEYYQWEQSYTHYQHIKQANELLTATTFEEYVNVLEKMDDVVYVVSFEGIYKESTLQLENYAEVLGISKEQYEAGGTFLFSEEKMEYVLDNISNEPVIYELNKYNSFKFQNMPPVNGNGSSLSEIMLNRSPVGSAYSGLNVVVYDNFRQKLIDKRGYY